MFHVAVHLLTGRYAASQYNDRDQPEWPPHPARLYSALVDAWALADQDPAEAAALRWLESQPPPTITASEAGQRTVQTHFVPVNDAILVGSHGEQAKLDSCQRLLAEARAADRAASDKKTRRAVAQAQKALDKVLARMIKAGQTAPAARPGKPTAVPDVLPQARTRKARSFPVVLPHQPRVVFSWSTEPDPDVRADLDRLLGRVARLGHSSSLVTCAVIDEDVDATHVPDDNGDQVIRVVGGGQLDLLVDAYERHRGVESGLLPHRKQRYRRAEHSPLPPSGPWGEWLVLERVGGSQLPLSQAARVAMALRGAVMHHAKDPIPAVISGHTPDGGRGLDPHVAWLALPFVGHAHATGSLLGVAMVLPRGIDPDDRAALLQALGRWRREGEGGDQMRLTLGRAGALELRLVPPRPRRVSLRQSTWTGPARRWVSVTPVALGRNPGDLRARSPSALDKAWSKVQPQLVADCERQGLPAPVRVQAGLQPLVTGGLPVGRFPPYPARKGPGRFRRVLVHALIEFEQPVRGPVLLGAGRHAGLGLFRPLPPDPER